MKPVTILAAAALALASLAGAQTNISTVIASDANGYTTQNAATFTVRGVVTTVNLDPTHLNFYIQDATGAIDVYKASSAAFYTSKALQVGADVTITGTVQFYNGLVELTPGADTDIVKNGTAALPAPQVITINDLQNLTADDQARFLLRGKVIKLLNVYKASTSVAWPAAGADANMTIAVGSATATPTGVMRIDKDTDVDNNTEPTWPQNVTGVLTQFDNATPYYSGFQLTVRAYSDIQPASAVEAWMLY